MIVTRKHIEEMAASLARTTTSPEFLGIVDGIRKRPPPCKITTAGEVVDRLKRDIPLPDDFRVTTRKFEMPRDPVVYFDESEGTGCVAHEGGVITVVNASARGGRVPQEQRGAEDIASIIREGIEEICRFVQITPFVALLDDLYARSGAERWQFVDDVILDDKERTYRGVSVPDDLMIQRSVFGDGRPTLFCVTKVVPLAYPWQKVTITFDDE